MVAHSGHHNLQMQTAFRNTIQISRKWNCIVKLKPPSEARRINSERQTAFWNWIAKFWNLNGFLIPCRSIDWLNGWLKISAESYPNRLMCAEVIVCHISAVFRHNVSLLTCVIGNTSWWQRSSCDNNQNQNSP